MKIISYKELTPEVIEKLGKPCYWGEPDQERYEAESADEAIADIIDGYDYTESYLPEGGEIELVAMTPVPFFIGGRSIIETVLEGLDEEYGDPDGGKSEPTGAMLEAAQALADVVRQEYKPWLCEESLRVVVDVAAWLKQHKTGA